MKIKAQDLRIGNYLNCHMDDEDESDLALSIIDWQDLKWICINIEDFNKNHEPIPLTESELMKFGFEKCYAFTSELHPFYDWKICVESMEIRICLPYFSFTFNDGEDQIYIKNVHQLQNLIHSITNKELTYKP